MSAALDTAVRAYRAQLIATADLSPADLDEIEDHFRIVVGELTALGIAEPEALATAAQRLGEPAALAREHAHARTSSGFGIRLPRARAWGAVALLAPLAVLDVARFGVSLLPTYAVVAVLYAALAARLTWARALLLGLIAFALGSAFARCAAHVEVTLPLIGFGGAALLLAPWTRRELGAPGWALAALGWAYGAVATTAALEITAPDGSVMGNPYTAVAAVALVIAISGALLRARWAALAAAVAAITMPLAASVVWPLIARFPHPLVWRSWTFGALAAGELGVVIAGAIAWRTARSHLGSPRALAR